MSSPDGCADTLELPSGAVAAGEGEGFAAAVVRVIIKQTASDLNTAAVHKYSHRETQGRGAKLCCAYRGSGLDTEPSICTHTVDGLRASAISWSDMMQVLVGLWLQNCMRVQQ